MRPTCLLLATALLASLSGAAHAHVKLVASSPADNASVARPARVELRFSEKLIAPTVKTEIVMVAMPGMKDHPPMKIRHTSQMGKDGKSMTLMPKTALVSGTYKVTWSAAGADTHRMGSGFHFTVK